MTGSANKSKRNRRSGNPALRSGQPPAQGRNDVLWLVPFLLLLVGGVTVALLAGGNDSPPIPTFSPEPSETISEKPTEKPAADERPATFGRVHALAELADGRLFVAAEDGPWLLKDADPKRADGPRLKLSALVTTADGQLLGSGLKDGGKAPLGLARRNEQGDWKPLSLDGQALFGKLRVLGAAVYGWDAGSTALMVSAPGGQWETRSVEAKLLDFVVDPANGEHLVRAVPEGGVGLPEVQDSTDGGRTWKRVAAPSLFLFSWTAADRLWALTEDGTIFRSRDGGHSWSPRNILPAPPTAMLDTGERLYVALEQVGVYASDDDGATWKRLDKK